MSSMDALIRETLNKTSNTTIDAAINIVVSLKPEYIARSTDLEIGADEALNEIIRLLHIFKLKMNELDT